MVNSFSGNRRYRNRNYRKVVDVYSKSVRAGKRTYFFDVKPSLRGDYFLTITERKKRFRKNGTYFYEKHKLFLYKEDFEKFVEGLNDVINYIKEHNIQLSSQENEKYDEIDRNEDENRSTEI
ncbi:MAG: PUR family DNA/RNA-binding protein [Bacteroidales bacterium]|nr:PUR family DNA/RNA-binding protein [Bacteroidales bacterium]